MEIKTYEDVKRTANEVITKDVNGAYATLWKTMMTKFVLNKYGQSGIEDCKNKIDHNYGLAISGGRKHDYQGDFKKDVEWLVEYVKLREDK